jgi:hypothetical protein
MKRDDWWYGIGVAHRRSTAVPYEDARTLFQLAQ